MSSFYPLDFLTKTLAGNGFQVQKRITIAGSATKIIVLDLSEAQGKIVFGFPITVGISSGFAHLNTYSADSYTKGSAITIHKLNPKSDIVSSAGFYEGSSPVGVSTPREYIVGAESTRQNAGGGFVTNDNLKILSNKPIIFEFENQETTAIEIAFGYTWFECKQ